MATKKTLKNSKIYCCELCDFSTSSSCDYKRHVSTLKHQKRDLATIGNHLATQKNSTTYVCDKCNKNYCDKSGLWRHNKICKPNTDAINNFVINKELVMLLMQENNELKHMMMEEHKSSQQMMLDTQNNMMDTQSKMLDVIKNGTNNTTHINSHNKTFNLNFFLNETCKNAMNIMDFVDSLKLQLNDLERMGEIGFVNGMSNIIIKNLQSMDITERPVHCTDQKREVIYVKDDNKWDKEEDAKPKLRKAIKHIAHKNAKLIGEFKIKHPDYKTCASKISTQYNTMVIEAMGGIGCVDVTNENKIIKRISKEIMVEKE
jgi:hypothetical protein